ncbi:hypothetical protein [Kibdelosporangium aridum]|uniref:Uncharacterized protein n=1 Tax=Kibdelosporangium aridum TaxID=2030 RepID=A0A1W2FM42_KIBAR|nr:hypothetical protein [Kibdelosporangium aridum]SMD23001.1 hypothetical protein SAMN05661093_07782 [Kibdelosporangium aridum]
MSISVNANGLPPPSPPLQPSGFLVGTALAARGELILGATGFFEVFLDLG